MSGKNWGKGKGRTGTVQVPLHKPCGILNLKTDRFAVFTIAFPYIILMSLNKFTKYRIYLNTEKKNSPINQNNNFKYES